MRQAVLRFRSRSRRRTFNPDAAQQGTEPGLNRVHAHIPYLPQSPFVMSLNHAAFNLIGLNAFKERFEIALSKSIVAFALNELKENRANHRARENLQ